MSAPVQENVNRALARRARVRRMVALALLGTTIAAGLAVHVLGPASAATDIAGDVLYALAAYLLAVVALPTRTPLVPGALAATWCVAVELFQLTGIPLAAGAAFPPAMLVLGTVFDPRDLAVYPVTVIAAATVDVLVRRLVPAPTPDP